MIDKNLIYDISYQLYDKIIQYLHPIAGHIPRLSIETAGNHEHTFRYYRPDNRINDKTYLSTAG